MTGRSLPAGPTNRPKVEPGVYRLTRAASPQFVTPIVVRIVRHLTDRHPPWGWAWVDGYQLNAAGDATARRELFVMVEGLERVPDPVRRPSPSRRAPVRHGPVRVGA